MGSVYINGSRANFIGISDIVDSLSPNSASFTIELLGYSTKHRLGQTVEVYGYESNLLAIGTVRNESVKIGVRSRSNLEAVGYSNFLNWQPITGRYKGSLRTIIAQLIVDAGLSEILLNTRFLTNSLAPEAEININFSYQFLHQCLDQILKLSGYALTYRIPISEKLIEINEPGFGNPAPITDLNLANLYNNLGLGIQTPINYKIIPPIASKIIVYGRNGLRSLSNGSVLPIDIKKHIANGETQFESLRTAEEIIKVLVTRPPAMIDGCSVGMVLVTGENYTYGGASISGLPSLQVPDGITDAGTVTKSWTISNADNEISTVLSYVTFIGDPTTNGILEIKVDGSTLTTISIDGTINNIVFDIDLTGYPGTDIPIEAILSISSQAELLSIAEAHIAVACCRMATIAGNPNNFIGSNRIFGDGGDARAAGINIPTAITTDVDNNLYIAHEGQASSNGSDLIRKVNASDNIINTLVGGSATYPPVDGGSPTDYQFKYIGGIAQYNDEIYFIDSFPNYIWKTDLLGTALTLVYEDPAGNGSSAFYVGLAIDPTSGDLFIADQGNHIILKLANGATSTTIYAGTSGSSGFSGDGGAATSAQLSLSATPIGLNTDSNGNLYISDTGNQRIRKVTKATGIITTIAGNPSASFGGDYRNSTDTYIDPNGVAISTSGEIVFFDQAYKVIRKITNENKLKSIAGYVLIHNTDSVTFDGELQPGSPGFYGDGHASTFAAIGSVGANLIYDQNGEIVFLDPDNYAIRKLICTTLVTCPSITVSKISTSGDVTNASENQIDITGGNSNDPATSTSGSATYEIDLTSPDFIGHSVTATFVYSFTMQSVSTSTTANINNTITIDGDTVLSVVASNPFTAPGSGSENGTTTVDLTKYLGKIVTVVITIDQFFDTAASGVTIGFSLDTTLSC